MHTTPQAAPAALSAGLSNPERLALRQISEHTELLLSLKRCAFLLNSARLVMTDQVARDIASEAVTEARALIARCEVS